MLKSAALFAGYNSVTHLYALWLVVRQVKFALSTLSMNNEQFLVNRSPETLEQIYLLTYKAEDKFGDIIT